MIEEGSSEPVEELIKEAEVTLRKSLAKLGQWGEQARELVRNKPSVVLAAAAVSGFVSGTVLRQSFTARRSTSERRKERSDLPQELTRERLGVDPIIWVAGGLVAGVLMGPRLVGQALAGLEGLKAPNRPSEFSEYDPDPLRATGSMNERPFEKF